MGSRVHHRLLLLFSCFFLAHCVDRGDQELKSCESTAEGDQECAWDKSPDDLEVENAPPPSSLPRRRLVSANDPTCVDEDSGDCFMREMSGHCARDANNTIQRCPASCNVCNNHNVTNRSVKTCYGKEQDANEPETMHRILAMQEYMIREVFVDDVYKKCQNRHAECAYWASTGDDECEKNPGFMKVQCAPACFSCRYLDLDFRCPFKLKEAQEATMWRNPGDLDRFFSNLVSSNEYPNLRTLSQPVKPTSAQDVLDGPWIVQIDDFLSPSECERFIRLGQSLGYKRSKDVGKRKFDGSFDSLTSESRTSTTAWCSKGTICDTDFVTHNVTQRIANLTHIPSNYSENLQLLKYEVGQFYGVHHDFTKHLVGRAQGVRILTVFLYLNEQGLEGGGTNFPQLNLTVMPKRGRALVWPSVLDQDPGKVDDRTEHQALPVEAGIKYGANAWIHERDFRTPLAQGCSV